MTSKIRFHCLTEGALVSSWLRGCGWEQVPLADAEVICFNGGADIGTSIYGERPAVRGVPRFLSARDQHEIAVFDDVKYDRTKLKLGICRGAQLLNCLNGGTLWQDVDGHGSDHSMTVLETGHVMPITSTHHQMMRPHPTKATIIGVSDEATYKLAEHHEFPGAFFTDDHKDAEIVYYADTNSLCIQGHPEYVPGSEFAQYSLDLVNKYLTQAAGVLGTCAC